MVGGVPELVGVVSDRAVIEVQELVDGELGGRSEEDHNNDVGSSESVLASMEHVFHDVVLGGGLRGPVVLLLAQGRGCPPLHLHHRGAENWCDGVAHHDGFFLHDSHVLAVSNWVH